MRFSCSDAQAFSLLTFHTAIRAGCGSKTTSLKSLITPLNGRLYFPLIKPIAVISFPTMSSPSVPFCHFELWLRIETDGLSALDSGKQFI